MHISFARFEPLAARELRQHGWVVVTGPAVRSRRGGSHADQAGERQEREAVRGAQGQGDVEGASGEDRELAGRIEEGRQELGILTVAPVERVGLGWEPLAEGRGRQKGWQGDSEKDEELNVTESSNRGDVEKTEQDLDRELNELLQELRVMLPGVQVLLAFLLTVPFTNRFATLTDGERGVYFAAVGLTSLAIVLLMTPGVQHRIRFREHDKEALLESSNGLLILASVVVGAAILCVLFLISEYLYGLTTGLVVTASLFVVIFVLWYITPWRRRRDHSGHDIEH